MGGMKFSRFRDERGAGEGGASGATPTGGGSAPGGDAWKASLAGGDQSRAKVLEGFKSPDEFWAKVSAPAQDAPDWRRVIAGDDSEELKSLERFADPAAYRKAFRDTQTALRESGRIKLPGENATDEERTAFARALGVPEKVDGYKIEAKPADGYEVSESDKGFLDHMTTKLHEALSKGANPNQLVSLAHQIYYDAAAQGLIDRENGAADRAAEGERINKTFWGSEYEPNIRRAIEGFKHFLPWNDEVKQILGVQDFDEAVQKFGGRRFEDGTAFMDDPLVQRMFAGIARDLAVEDPIFNARGEGSSFDPNKRWNELMKLRETSPREYAKPEIQKELAQLAAAGERQGERASERGSRAA